MTKLVSLFFVFGIILTGGTFSIISHAQDIQTLATTAPPLGYPVVQGVVKMVTPTLNTVKIKHEEIPNLDMSAMTMTFSIAAELAQNIDKNDKVKFVADNVDGTLTVLWIEKEN